jgi:hypothetical protein
MRNLALARCTRKLTELTAAIPTIPADHALTNVQQDKRDTLSQIPTPSSTKEIPLSSGLSSDEAKRWLEKYSDCRIWTAAPIQAG